MRNVRDESLWLLLGAGGNAPRVDALDVRLRRIVPVLELPAGHSVYRIVRAPRGDRAAALTKDGTVHILDTASSPPTPSGCTLHHGAPLLDACFVGDDTVVTSDTLGRCLAWEPSSPIPTTLRSSGSPIAAWRVTNRNVVGLSARGEVIVWPAELDGAPVGLPASAPPTPLAAVSSFGIAETGRVIFPTAVGALIDYDGTRGQLRFVKAHQGACAVAGNGGRLISAGRTDRTWRVWACDPLEATEEYSAPANVLSVAFLAEVPLTVAFVLLDGAVEFHEVQGGLSASVFRLDRGDYRCMLGADPGAVERERAQALDAEARAWALEVAEDLEDRRFDRMAEPLRRLREGGYRPLALCFEAQAAAAQEDLLGELEARLQLEDLLPERPDLDDSRRRLAHLLERLLLFGSAAGVMERLCGPPHADDRVRIDRLQELTAALSNPYGLASPDSRIPVARFIAAAQRMYVPFTASLVLRTLEAVGCAGTHLSPATYVGRFAPELHGTRTGQPPALVEARVLGANGTVLPASLVIWSEGPEDTQAILFALRFEDHETETVVTPILVLRPPRFAEGASVTEHNHRLQSYVSGVLEQRTADRWIGATHRLAQEVLKACIGEALGARRRGIGT